MRQHPADAGEPSLEFDVSQVSRIDHARQQQALSNQGDDDDAQGGEQDQIAVRKRIAAIGPGTARELAARVQNYIANAEKNLPVDPF